jgi:hypothetical protein
MKFNELKNYKVTFRNNFFNNVNLIFLIKIQCFTFFYTIVRFFFFLKISMNFIILKVFLRKIENPSIIKIKPLYSIQIKNDEKPYISLFLYKILEVVNMIQANE